MMLFVEVTQMLDYARRGENLTGIQRLTFNTAMRLTELLGAENVKLLAYSVKYQEFRTADPALLFQFWQHDSKDDQSPLGKFLSTLKPLRLKNLNPNMESWDYALFGKADKILLTEAWWWQKDVVTANKLLAQLSQATIIRFIHDLIPVTQSRFVGADFSHIFERGLLSEIKNSDLLIANSKATAKDLNSYLKRNKIKKAVKIVPLAHEFQLQKSNTKTLTHSLLGFGKTFFAKLKLNAVLEGAKTRPIVVGCGTFEERKNLFRLLKAWQSLLKIHGPKIPTLVLVGRWGYPSNHIKRFLKNTRYLDGNVKLLFDIDDEGLLSLYEASKFSIYLSYAEGWGLPVGESMWLHKPVIASNSSSIPEVGGNLIDYVDPSDDGQISAAIEKLAFDETHYQLRLAALQKAKLRTWDMFSEELAIAMGYKDVQPKK